jgi:hypothetical protein
MRHRHAANTPGGICIPFQLRAEVTVSKAFAMVLLAIAAVAGCGGGGDGPIGQTTFSATVSIQGVIGPSQQVATGTLSNVVAKNRAAGQLLETTLPAGAAPGQPVVNSTHSSRACVYKSGNRLSRLLGKIAPESL